MGLCVQLAHFISGDWKDISIAHVIIVMKSEVSTFPILIIFSMVVCLRCLLHHNLSLIAYTFPESGNLFSKFLCSLWWVQIFGYVLACRSYSFLSTVHHLIIIIVQIYLKVLNLWNACQIYFVECVRLSIFSPLSIIQYVGLYLFVYPFLLWWLREYIYIYTYILCLIIIIKSEVWTITHCLGLGHETMVSAVCLSIFFFWPFIQRWTKIFRRIEEANKLIYQIYHLNLYAKQQYDKKVRQICRINVSLQNV